MAYATLADIQGLMAKFTISATSTPTTTQATAIITDVALEIDSHLAGAGYGLPVASPQWFVDWLGLLNAYGATAAILKSMFPQSEGGGEASVSRQSFWESRYRAGLKGIDDGKIVIPDAPRGIAPSTYLTRTPDEEEDLGDIAEPVFKMGKIF